MQKLQKSIKLGEIKGNRESQAICVALFNLQGVNAFRMAHSNEDTTFVYGIYTEQKIRKDRQATVAAFVEGFNAGVRIYY
jgi:hypothetical protein